ncbi:DNA polymerase I [Ferrovibrio sp.]|uniref:DNA polymerase I n=1 Tax=Ferrovibrio sp. TaxID=1917215 RepID=UPI0025C6B876|nr:DNA polymerase I [Ferrovibrio sp.]MBX3453425.1 DNA polymerase I [Ferrovibrio sp.]
MAGQADAAPHRLYLIDGSGYIFRAYHALPPLTRKSDGMPVGAVSGFCNMLASLRERAEADGRLSHMAVIFDAGRVTFRNEIYPAYKANRDETPEDLTPQFAPIKQATRAFALPAIEMEGFEADDLIATYARMARLRGMEVVVVSSDKDLMQLVREGVSLFDPMKNRPIGPTEVMEKFGVSPDKVVDVQALAGDSTDNVPGVPGIGVKTAAELINAYGDLDSLLARAGEIKQPKRRETLLTNADKARVSRELVKLKDDVTVGPSLEDLAIKAVEWPTLDAFLEEMEFRTLRGRLEARFKGLAPSSKAQLIDPDTPRLQAEAATPEAAPEAAYELVQDIEALRRWVAEAEAAGILAVDTETTDLSPTRADLVGISLSTGPGRACYIPVGHGAPNGDGLDLGGGGRPKQIPLADVVAALKPLLIDASVLKVGQNIKYDMVVLARHGLHVTPYDDTMLLSYALDAGKHGHGMDELAERHLGHSTIKYDDVTGTGKARITFDRVPLDKALNYAAEDADITLRLHRLLKPRLLAEKRTRLYEEIERPLPAVVAEMELAGIKVDKAELNRLSADFAGRMADLERKAHDLAEESFNLGSPKQLGEILFDKMKLPGGKKGKTGAYGTGADILEDLAAQGHDLPRVVLDWRQLQKLKSTYTDALQEQIGTDGRVHTSFSLAATSTGRFASTDPNLQNIPIRTEEGRKIRRAFVAEPGHVLISADYSQIELRILADIADIPALKQAFLDGVDIHALTASQVFDVPLEGMDPMVRRSAKAINFGIIYGMSAFGLAAQLGIPQREAAAYIDAYFKRYPGIRAYMDRTKKQAHEQGYVETAFGRRVHLPNINSRNPAERAFLERAAINAPIQGTAADVIKRAMGRLPAALAADGLKARMLLQVHDELVFEAPADQAEATMALAKQVMQSAAKLSVPLDVEAGQGANWDDAH